MNLGVARRKKSLNFYSLAEGARLSLAQSSWGALH
jgi:hypothetical protein